MDPVSGRWRCVYVDCIADILEILTASIFNTMTTQSPMPIFVIQIPGWWELFSLSEGQWWPKIGTSFVWGGDGDSWISRMSRMTGSLYGRCITHSAHLSRFDQDFFTVICENSQSPFQSSLLSFPISFLLFPFPTSLTWPPVFILVSQPYGHLVRSTSAPPPPPRRKRPAL